MVMPSSLSGKPLTNSQAIIAVLLAVLTLSFCVASTSASVGELQVEWQEFSPRISGASVIQTTDGGYVAFGTNATFYDDPSQGAEYVNTSYLLVKTDANGSLTWTKTIPQEDPHEMLSLMIPTSDGGFAFAGTKPVEVQVELVKDIITSENVSQFYLLKADSLGNIQWNRTYVKADIKFQNTIFRNFIQTNDGGYALVGTYTFGDSVPLIWCAKTDSSGNLQWNRTIDAGYAIASSIVQTSEGGYMLLGQNYVQGGGDSILAVKLDSSGNTQWIKEYPNLGRYTSSSSCGIATSDGGYVIGGSTYIDYQGTYGLLVKIDASGNLLWNNTYGEPDSRISSVAQTADNGYIFAASTGSSAWIVKTDNAGKIDGQIKFKNPDFFTNQPKQIITTTDGGYAFVGDWNAQISNPTSGQKFWLVKLSPTITTNPPPNNNPSNLLTAVVIIIIVSAGAGLLLVYFRKRHKT
jgi:hypothetical protein